MAYSFALTGGGTGGHVIPAIAVARVLQSRGHQILFIGTQQGMEARLVPDAGFEIRYIQSGGLNRVGFLQRMQTMGRLPAGLAGALRLLRVSQTNGVFSMGGYVAGPVMIAAALARIPIIVMEPNAMPGFANRKMARRVYKALLGFEETRRWFPAQRSEVTGLPVRPEFFSVQPKTEGVFTVLITGGSRGARTLNRASRESWKLFREAQTPVRIVHQTGLAEHEALSREFASSGLAGEVIPFIKDMAHAFQAADVVVARSGAGSVNEIAAAGMPSVLVPFPYAADDHQRSNAETLAKFGAARMVLDAEMNGARLFQEVESLRQSQSERQRMGMAARNFARPGAAERAADVLEEAAQSKYKKVQVEVRK